MLIYNPQAGGLSGPRAGRLPSVIAALKGHGFDVVVQPTSGPGHATALAREAVAGEPAMVVVAGGDGTINEAVNGMAGCGTPLAVLPAGTANVLAMEMRIGGRLRRALEHFHELAPVRVSLGLFRGLNSSPRYFLLMGGVGLDAAIVLRVRPEWKRRLGKLSYWLAGLGAIGERFPQFHVTANGYSATAGFVLASRVRNYGGDLEIARSVSLLDDHFEVVIFEGEDSLRYLRYLGGILSGNLNGIEGVRVVEARRIEVTPLEGMEVHAQVDGEAAGRIPAIIELAPGALTLMAPPWLERRYGRAKAAERLSGPARA